MKKRICLIGMEHGCGKTAEVLTTERLIEVERWARCGGFDAVAFLHADDGLCDSAASARRTWRRLVEMKPKERDAWAESIADQVQSRWGSDQVINIVLLCGLSGYQELAQRLDQLRGGVLVTMPLAGTGLVPRRSQQAHATSAVAQVV